MNVNIFLGNKTNKVQIKADLTVKLSFKAYEKRSKIVTAVYSVKDALSFEMRNIPSIYEFNSHQDPYKSEEIKEQLIPFLINLKNNKSCDLEFWGRDEQHVTYDNKTREYSHFGSLIPESGGDYDTVRIKLDKQSRIGIVNAWRKLYYLKNKDLLNLKTAKKK